MEGSCMAACRVGSVSIIVDSWVFSQNRVQQHFYSV